MGSRRGAGLASKRLPVRVDNGTGKGASGMEKSSGIVERMPMEHGSKFLKKLFENCTQVLERLQCV
jgi:hypothetical protein